MPPDPDPAAADPLTPGARLARAQRSLQGLSLGDALGQGFFLGSELAPEALVASRRLPPGPWRVSDDTVQAATLLDVLAATGRVDQDALAGALAEAFLREPERGYGAVAYWLLHQLAAGRDWREAAREPYGGRGSLGNGAAMRVAPLGAWFAPDLPRAAAEAAAQAAVTHAHPEGQAGAVAVAVAAAQACARPPGPALLEAALAHTPPGAVQAGLARARALLGADAREAAAALGDGSLVTAADTVPFALWCAATHPRDLEAALWTALEGLTRPESDRDTVLAIVGGVVAPGAKSVPAEWLARRERWRGLP